MSDNCTHIVPVHESDYPNAEIKAQEVLQWFLERDIVENKLSDCTLGALGYRFKPQIASLFNDGDKWAFRENLITHGLEITAGVKRRVFHPMEGMYLQITCPHCKQSIPDDLGFEWAAQWYECKNDTPTCTNCNQTTHLTKYTIEPDWGFSNFAITLWNTHWDFSPDFLQAMEALLGAELKIVQVRI